MFANGPIPDGIHVCHTCDNPRCVNLAHLFLGTQAENVADMMAKGRHRTAPPKTPRRDETFLRGERHPHARLTWEKVCAIRQLHQDGAMGTAELATHFGVTQTHIQYIVTGKSWRVRA
jgi:hypothetical protein